MKLGQKHTDQNFRVLLDLAKVQLPHFLFDFRKVNRKLIKKKDK